MGDAGLFRRLGIRDQRSGIARSRRDRRGGRAASSARSDRIGSSRGCTRSRISPDAFSCTAISSQRNASSTSPRLACTAPIPHAETTRVLRAAVSSSRMRRASATFPAAASRCASPNDGPAMPPARPPPRLVGRARLVEAAERFERAREVGVRAVETRVELDRHAIGQHRLLVLAREVVRVAEHGVDAAPRADRD